jgi:iron complex outermembrane receptor protein
MDSNYMAAQGISSVGDILKLTPGASWGAFTAAQPAPTMRGIESYQPGNATMESSVQIVVDGVAVTKAFMMTPPAYDLERVEIMRGPQGTTFGRNATLGLGHFITARPSQDFSASFDTSVGTLNLFSVKGHVNGALTDTVSGRLAFNRRVSDGALEDENTGEALEDYDNTSIRGSLMIEPSDTFSAFVKLEHTIDDNLPAARRGDMSGLPWLSAEDGYLEEYTPNADVWKASISTPPDGGWYMERDMTNLTAELIWSLGDLTVTSISAYQNGDHETMMDVFATPEVLQDQYVSNKADVLSTELRIDNHASADALRWLGGIYLLDDTEDRIEANTNLPERGVGGGKAVAFAPRYIVTTATADTTSIGIYGEFDYDITDRMTFNISGRYTEDSRDYSIANVCSGSAGYCGAFGIASVDTALNDLYYVAATDCSVIGGTCGDQVNPSGLVTPLKIDDTWDNFSGKVSLGYALGEHHNIYGLVSQGFKSGGFQHDARNIDMLYGAIVGEETLTNYEFGWKADYDTVRFAVTAFYMEQEDTQANSILPFGTGGYATILANLGGIDTVGFEFEGTWLVSEHLLIGGNFAIYDSELSDGTSFAAGLDGEGNINFIDVSGADYGLDDTYVLYAEYDFAGFSGSTFRARADVQHRSSVAAPANQQGIPDLAGNGSAFEKPSIHNVGASLTWIAADEMTEVSFWGKNLTDDYDLTNFGPSIASYYANLDVSGKTYDSPGAVGSPSMGVTGRRQVGVDVRFRF